MEKPALASLPDTRHTSGMSSHTRKKRPRDPNQLGKIIVDISVGEVEDRAPTPKEEGKNPGPVALGPWALEVVSKVPHGATLLFPGRYDHSKTNNGKERPLTVGRSEAAPRAVDGQFARRRRR